MNMSNLKRVLFVCTGNTCRSPMAEALFRHAVIDRPHLLVASAGIMARDGAPASAETISVLNEMNIPLERFRSHQINASIIEKADEVFVMTEAHLISLERAYPSQARKFHLVSEFIDDPNAHIDGDVPDPFGMGAKAYADVARMLQNAIPNIVSFVDPQQFA